MQLINIFKKFIIDLLTIKDIKQLQELRNKTVRQYDPSASKVHFSTGFNAETHMSKGHNIIYTGLMFIPINKHKQTINNCKLNYL